MRIAIVAPARGARGLTALLGCIQLLDEQFLLSHPKFPRIYESGVHYQREPAHHEYKSNRIESEERWLTIPECYAQGWGDCDDLAPWLAAERRVRDKDADARAVIRKVATHKWHVVVARGDGSIEDPSKVLGMPG